MLHAAMGSLPKTTGSLVAGHHGTQCRMMAQTASSQACQEADFDEWACPAKGSCQRSPRVHTAGHLRVLLTVRFKRRRCGGPKTQDIVDTLGCAPGSGRHKGNGDTPLRVKR